MTARGFALADVLMGLAAKQGAEASVSIREGNAGYVRFAANEITTSGEVSATTVRLTLAFGRRHATSETNQLDQAALATFVERTAALAKLAPDDPEYVPVLGPQLYPQNPHAWDDATSHVAPSVRAAAARTAIDASDAAGLVAAGFVQTHADNVWLANSLGLRATHRGTWAQMTTTARTTEPSSGWAGAEATRAEDLDVAALSTVAVTKAKQSRGATRLDPGRYTVVLEPAAVADLLGFLIDALDARAADQGRSFFSQKGDFFDPSVVLRSDPFDPALPGCPWDDDGIPLKPITWIAGGKVEALHSTRFWAQKSGRPATGAHNTFQLSSSAGASSPASLVSGVRRGLLVTRFWYTRWLEPKSLLITGLTRDGVWLIEDGKVTRPVNNFRFNDSPVKMLGRVVGMTAATYRVPSWGNLMRVPVVCCDDFEMASVSDAV